MMGFYCTGTADEKQIGKADVQKGKRMKENQNLRVIPLSKIENLKVHGRTTGELSPLTLFWTGSMLELNVSGSRLLLNRRKKAPDSIPVHSPMKEWLNS
jgi:hypothetical protein